MDHFIRINGRFLPLHAITHIDDSGEEVLIAVRDVRHGSSEIRITGQEAGELRQWLEEHTAVTIGAHTELQDTGVRLDD